MLNLLGVMQGRLLPKFNANYQAHPYGYWEDEFPLAHENGLELIEFILDFDKAYENPLINSKKIDYLANIISNSKVKVKTVCADYFMIKPFHRGSLNDINESLSVLEKIINNGNVIGLTDIVIPCVDNSSISTLSETDTFIKNISKLFKLLDTSKINLSLETDLNPDDFYKLLTKIDFDRVKVNYDIGNSASLGFNPIEEFEAYGHLISDVHIKDRAFQGGSVILGSGASNFEVVFAELSKKNYKGPFIMQAYRDDQGIEVFKEQLRWFKSFLDKIGWAYS